MSRQGYLILHDKRQSPRVCFFSLEDGYLRYYASAHCSKQLGEVRLSGCKIVVKAMRRTDGIANSFFVETRKVNVKERSYTLGAPVRLELSAHSNDERQDWGKMLFSWQRYYWRDPAADSANTDTSHQLEKIRAELEMTLVKICGKTVLDNNQQTHNSSITSSVVGSTASAALSVAKQPLSFLRKNASSLRRSFSLYMPSTTTSTASTVSSTASPSSTGKTKADVTTKGPEATDCEKDKVVLATVGTSNVIYRGDNQQEACVY